MALVLLVEATVVVIVVDTPEDLDLRRVTSVVVRTTTLEIVKLKL